MKCNKKTARTALLVILFCSSAGWMVKCSVPGNYKGFYSDSTRLILNPLNSHRPSMLEKGNHWIMLINYTEKKPGTGTERNRQTTVLFEFAQCPPLQAAINLAHVPIQASYEYGGQKTVYISRKAKGTLKLRMQDDKNILAQMDVTFFDPILGTGNRSVKNEIILKRLPHPIFN